MANGKYVGFVDSDDYIASKMYEILYDNIVKNDADLAVCSYVHMDEKYNEIKKEGKGPISQTRCFTQKEFVNEITRPYGGYYIVTWNKLYKRTLFDEVKFPFGRQHEDEFIIHHIVGRCNKIVCVPDELYFYYHRNDSIMSAPFNVKYMDFGDALIDRYHYTKQKGFKNWKDHTVIRLSYELEKWSAYADENQQIKDKYNELRRKSLFLLFEKKAWQGYSVKGRIHWRIKLLINKR